MKKSRILTFLGLCVTGIGNLCYTNSVFAAINPTVAISFGTQVGDSKLTQVEGLPSSTSFYKSVDISVSDVSSYYVSVFLDCSSLTDEDKAKCEAGNLLSKKGTALPSVDSAKTFSTMSNEWGFRYNIGDSVSDPKDKYFAPLPTTKANGYIQLDGEERIKTDSSTNSDSKTLTLGFGAKVDGDTAAGTYNGKVTVAVVASPREATMLSEVTYLQEMTHTICANTLKPRNDAVYPTTDGNTLAADASNLASGTESHLTDDSYIPVNGLIDKRDGKSYLVAKLADDNCWMIQNLALQAGTKIDSDWSDLGEGVEYTLPPSTKIGYNEEDAESMYNGTHTDNKTDNYLPSRAGTINGAGDGSGDNYGAFYTWYTAIANSLPKDFTSGAATMSICPKGWTLPAGGSTGNFVTLYKAYDEDDTKFKSTWLPGYGGVYVGSYGNETDRHGDNGSYSIYWTKDVYHQDSVRTMFIYSGGSVGPNYQYSNKYGYQVRCIAR